MTLKRVGAEFLGTFLLLFAVAGSGMNPEVTAARTVTNTYTGVSPARAAGYVAAQLMGAALAVAIFGWLKSTPTKGT